MRVLSPRVSGLIALAMTVGCVSAEKIEQTPSVVSRIAFGSCAHQDKPQPIWNAIVEQQPDLFIFLGDNIYGDTTDMQVLRSKYEMLGSQPGYQRLLGTCRVLATWDDHDYGANDAGREYPMKEESEAIFLDFFNEPLDSARRARPGIYTSYLFGPKGQRVQVVLLDVRYFRSPLRTGEPTGNPLMGDYIPVSDPSATMLGQDQWEWLKDVLREPADIRIIGSSTQFIAEFSGYEAWANMPSEKERMIHVIKESGANGIIFISGDMHWGELSLFHNSAPYPIHDLTSSGLTETWSTVAPNRYRLGAPVRENNFGQITIAWDEADPLITLQIRDAENRVKLEHQVRLRELSPPVRAATLRGLAWTN